MHLCGSSDSSSTPLSSVFGVLAPLPRPKTSVLRDADQPGKWASGMVNDLAGLVGGIDALERLDAVQLPGDPFNWAAVADTDRAVVCDVLARIDDCVERAYDIEYRTIARRLLERIAALDPNSLRRGSVVRTAAAITWLALRGNGRLDGRGWPTADGLWAMFGVSSCAARGRSLFSSTGLTPRPGADTSVFSRMSDVWLRDPNLLHSRTRALVLQYREATIRNIEAEAAKCAEAHPIKRLPDGNLRIAARTVTPRWAIRAPTESGRALVLATFGESEDDPEVLALSVSDARHLVNLLERALDSPTPTLAL
jgi:hypothetical protein